MRRLRPHHLIVATLALLLLAVLVGRKPAVSDETAALLVNRIWVERLPRDQRDQVMNAVWLQRDGQQVGAVGRSSSYRLRIDVFGWRLEKNRLLLHFPQDNQRVDLEARARRCTVQGFELCLELEGQRGVVRLYSREDWIIEGSGTPSSRALLDAAISAPPISADCERCSVGLPAALFD
jgi:hypothetical protein